MRLLGGLTAISAAIAAGGLVATAVAMTATTRRRPGGPTAAAEVSLARLPQAGNPTGTLTSRPRAAPSAPPTRPA